MPFGEVSYTDEPVHMSKEHFEYIRGRIMTDLATQKPSGFFSVALACVGIAVTAVCAWLALPHVANEVKSGAEGDLIGIAVVAMLFALVLYGVHRVRKSDIHRMATELCKQLDMYAHYTPPPPPPPTSWWRRTRYWAGDKIHGKK
jgi:hypothetical protein